jgi:hypothetical protein
MNRRSITMVVVVVLCAVGFAYGQGWLHWSRAGTAIETNKADAQHVLRQDKVKEDAALTTQQAETPADTTTK